jgi:hypothetical protein
MKLEFDRVEKLPSHAWAATLSADAARVCAVGGDNVSFDPSSNVVWEGLTLHPGAPIRDAEHHFGLTSGCAAIDGALFVWTPGHCFDRIFIVQNERGVFASNSLPFALRVSGGRLKPNHIHYPWYLGRISEHAQTVPILGGRLTILANANATLRNGSAISVAPKDPSPEFHDFRSYLARMHAFIDEVAAANLHQAGGPYTPITSISTGYDSPAASVLSLRMGTRQALSFVDARGGGNDSGEEIGRCLGLSVTTASRTDYQRSGWEAERLFYVYGLPEDISFYAFRNELGRRLLFTGLQGDTMWAKSTNSLGAEWSWDPGGATLQEFRLRTGFVHLPPAFFGWRHQVELQRISNSEEMSLWTLGTEYDRPVPRRIVEEQGVKRQLFGMTKMAVTATHGIDNDRYLGDDALGISDSLRQRLEEFKVRNAALAVRAEMLVCNAAHNLVLRAHRSAKRVKTSKHGSTEGNENWLFLLIKNLDSVISLRRRFMQPFSSLNFSSQVVNEDLANDYVYLSN